MVGICRGYQGLLNEDFFRDADGAPLMGLRSVSGTREHGGTVLRTSRCEEFRTEAGLSKAAAVLQKHASTPWCPSAATAPSTAPWRCASIGTARSSAAPARSTTIWSGTDYTIGFATAVQTAVEAVDKLRDTAESHERMFLVEVMGRHSGYIALYTALAGGAEVVCHPRDPTDVPAIVEHLKLLKSRGKRSIMVVVAEGDESGGAVKLQMTVLKAAGCPFETRVVMLGHLQRGGSPVPADRILATRLGDFAVESLLAGHPASWPASTMASSCSRPSKKPTPNTMPSPQSSSRSSRECRSKEGLGIGVQASRLPWVARPEARRAWPCGRSFGMRSATR